MDVLKCNKCGKEVLKGRYCPDCMKIVLKESKDSKDKAIKERKQSSDRTNNSPIDSLPLGYIGVAIFALLSFIITSLVTFLYYKQKIYFSLLAGATSAFGGTAILMFILIWMEFFIENFAFALMLIVAPVGMAVIIKQNPERWLKPYIIHAITAIITGIGIKMLLYYYFKEHPTSFYFYKR